MNLTAYSRNRILETFKTWNVPKDFADPMYNYLVHGFNPGGCFSSVLANDFHGAICRSHPSNTIEAFKALAGWIHAVMPHQSRGSYKAVDDWCYFTEQQRRAILEKDNLVYSEQEEIIKTLKSEYSREPVLY